MKLTVTYAGQPGTKRAEAFLGFLRTHVAQVREASVGDLGALDLGGVDVLIADGAYDSGPQPPERLALSDLPVPTVLIGAVGGRVGDALGLKLGWRYGCVCLDHRMIAPTSMHPIFMGPAPVPATTPLTIPSPASFLQYAAVKSVPATVDVLEVAPFALDAAELESAVAGMKAAAKAGDIVTWRALMATIPPPGLVTTGDGFTDSPDCEAILGGINMKAHDYVAVGRQGRFLQWGFEGPADTFNELGAALFLNAIAYIAEFADAPVLALRVQQPRAMMRTELAYATGDDCLARSFGGTAPVQVDLAGAVAWLDANDGYLRPSGDDRDGSFELDGDLVALQLANHDRALLDVLVKQLTDDGADGDRARRLWVRYVRRAPGTHEARWLEQNREHLFFSDWAGYRWVSALDVPAYVVPRRGFARSPQVGAALTGTKRADGLLEAHVQLFVGEGYHVYAPTATDGIPTTVELTSAHRLVAPPEFPAQEHLSGQVLVTLLLDGDSHDVDLAVRVQACNSVECLPPATIALSATFTDREEVWTTELTA